MSQGKAKFFSLYICITATGTLAVYPPEETNNRKNNEKMLRKERAS